MNSALVVVCVCGIIYLVVMLNFAFIERKALEGRECLSECDLKHIFNTCCCHIIHFFANSEQIKFLNK